MASSVALFCTVNVCDAYFTTVRRTYARAASTGFRLFVGSCEGRGNCPPCRTIQRHNLYSTVLIGENGYIRNHSISGRKISPTPAFSSGRAVGATLEAVGNITMTTDVKCRGRCWPGVQWVGEGEGCGHWQYWRCCQGYGVQQPIYPLFSSRALYD